MKMKLLSYMCISALLMGSGAAQAQSPYATLNPHHEPLVSNKPVNPNVLMILDTSGSMSAGMPVPAGFFPGSSSTSASRMQVLHQVVKNLLEQYRHNAFLGFTRLANRSPTGVFGSLDWQTDTTKLLLQPVTDLSDDAKYNKAIATVTDLKANGNTPLAFTLYETTKHLRGEPMLSTTKSYAKDGYNTFVEVDSPVRYRCQSQHVILLTDGAANMDGIAAVVSGDQYDEKGTLTPLLFNTTNLEKVGHAIHLQDLRFAKNKVYASDTLDAAGKPWNSKGSKVLNPIIHTILFGNDSGAIAFKPQLAALAKASKGVYEGDATDPAKLNEAFHKIFQTIIQTLSGAGAVEDQFERSLVSLRYSSSYDPAKWTGEIAALPYNATTQEYDENSPKWVTSKKIIANQGDFISFNRATKTVISDIVANGNELGLNPAPGSLDYKHLAWLKGNNVAELRHRAAGELLGDIINSDIEYIAKDRLYINLASLDKTVSAEFVEYLLKKARLMQNNLIVAGSNDGLLNFIYADKQTGGNGGKRHTSYFPSFFADDLAAITQKSYKHSYRVNGPTTLFDAYVGDSATSGEYKMLGATTMGAGKNGLVGYQIFSINKDLTSANSKIRPIYEIVGDDMSTPPAASTNPFAQLGYTFSAVEYFNQATDDGKFRAVGVFGNGFGVQDSVVYLINAANGDHLKTISLPGGSGGAGTPSLMVKTDESGYQYLDSLYVGDYGGTLYKVSFKTATPAERSSLDTDKVTPLYKVGGDGKFPITVKPLIVSNTEGSTWVYFGTGMAVDEDLHKGPKSKVTHSFYGIKDLDKEVTTLGKYEITGMDPQSTVKNESSAVFTSTAPIGNADEGWYMPLLLTGAAEATGERVIRPPALRYDEQVHFATWGITEGDDGDPCLSDDLIGKSLVLELDGSSPSTGGIAGHSGVGYYDNATGVRTGPGINVDGTHGGSTSEGKNKLPTGTIKDLIDAAGGKADASNVAKEDQLDAGKDTEVEYFDLEKGGRGKVTIDRREKPEQVGRIYFRAM